MTRRIARLVRAGWRDDDRGMSVVELLVAMVISTLLLASVSAMVISGCATVDAANQRDQAVNGQMRIAADRMTKQLRTADSYNGNTQAIIVAEAERIGFYAKLDTLDLTAADAGSPTQIPSVIWLWTRNGAGTAREICQQVYRGTPGGDELHVPERGDRARNAARTCQVVARGLSRDARRTRLFTYLKNADATYRTDGSSVSSVTAGRHRHRHRADIATIQSVEVWMTRR